ncbi:hypothetical protein AGMMS49982_11160 [Bacteroidia bacterium]|nr:hypothetical protein AGMMS49982_11160 [Bacteroidia bacterium]
MRHNNKINHLGRTHSHREALLSNMAVSLIQHKRILTTLAKAKELRKYVEPLITKSKEDTTHSRRVVFKKLRDKYAVTELFNDISQKIGNRLGGYTRIIKIGNRLGDNASICFIELVDYNELMLKGPKQAMAKTRRSRKKTETGLERELNSTDFVPQNTNDKKRLSIFEKYATNLMFLKENGFINIEMKYDKTYICPICGCQFSEKSLDQTSENSLTLEDAPPKSLGGSANVLTCKQCNNTCGYKIDSHLVSRMKELDRVKFIPETENDIIVKIDGVTLRGKIKVEKDGTIKILHSIKNNHPLQLGEIMEKVKKDMVIDMNFLKRNVIPENLEYALLKTGYLLFLEKFGYSLILDNCYNLIREQLLNPEKRIYPMGFWFKPLFPREMNGVYFVCDKGLESILVLFTLNTGLSETMFGTFLPLPINPLKDVIQKIDAKIQKEKTFPLTLYPQEQKIADYLSDKGNLAAMYKWIEERR